MTTAVTAPAPWITSSQQCSLETCPLTYAHTFYLPNTGGNAFYIALFGLFIPVQLFLGIRHRTWGFLVGLMCGLILEVLGYVARLKMRDNPFIDRWFVMYLVCLTIAPAFFSGAIYVSLARIVAVYSLQLSRLRQRTYSLLFIAFDILSLLLQAAGGAITTSDSMSTVQTGINIMIAGLASQVASLTLYLTLCIDFGWRVYYNIFRMSHKPEEKTSQNTTTLLTDTNTDAPGSDARLVLNPKLAALRSTKRWSTFLLLQGLATWIGAEPDDIYVVGGDDDFYCGYCVEYVGPSGDWV
ncbi:hypothetical protein EYZ11_004652 [Aspergillus tanneri]|uniref:RTA1-domain-containing protein n=1 Tax=Aspergillus tanneri TaxID=1220188 RepID=A0A4V3UPP6_9EURO|nr:hypothetical protein EYZ11_004652 [Aspergillus tanneri]